MYKRILALLIGFTLVLSFTSAVHTSDEIYSQFSDQFIENHDISLEIAREIQDSFEQTKSGETVHPKCFGGMYIDSDGSLVVLVVGDITCNETFFGDMRSSAINIRQVEFSYATLHSLIDTILYTTNSIYQRLGGDCIYIQNIHTFYLDTINNRVNVLVFNVDHIDYFNRTVVDHPAVEFVLVDHLLNERVGILQKHYSGLYYEHDYYNSNA